MMPFHETGRRCRLQHTHIVLRNIVDILIAATDNAQVFLIVDELDNAELQAH